MSATMAVTRAPKHEGYDALGSATTAGEDYDLHVDGRWIAWTYWGDALPAGQKWVSWGVAGWSGNHPTRAAAEAVQVREYAANPDLCDRLDDQREAERRAEAERRDAAEKAAAQERAEQRRRQRLGDDEPGATILVIPAYHVIYADQAEVDAVSAWLDAHGLHTVSGFHDIRVEQRAARQVVVYEQPTGRGHVVTETHVVTLTAAPPTILTQPRPDLHGLFDTHSPGLYPLLDYGAQLRCAHCSVPWPCPAVKAELPILGQECA